MVETRDDEEVDSLRQGWPVSARLRAKAAGEALRRQRIYRFWLLLRDASLGRSATPAIAQLLRRLEEGVDAGKLICPIEATSFVERHGQSDPLTRRATARLMDRLSIGICLAPWPERARTELWRFITTYTGRAQGPPTENTVWTRVGNVFGEFLPYHPGLDRETSERILSLWIPSWWERGLEQLLEVAGFEATLPKLDTVTLADRLNAGKRKHAGEASSYTQVLAAELRGTVDASEPVFLEVLQGLDQRAAGSGASRQEVRSRSAASMREWSVLIAEAFRKGRIKTELPFIDIPARLHAAVRWDRERNYDPNDWYDFEHAAAALPYCNMFWTERSLASLVTSLNLDKRYGSTVVSRPEDALEMVS